jgi:hypothetical protein
MKTAVTKLENTAVVTVPLFNRKFRDFTYLYIGKYLEVLHFCMCNFVSTDKADLALSAETKFHIQKYDGLENIEKRSRALEVILGPGTDTNLGRTHTKI